MPSPDFRQGPPTVPQDLVEYLEALHPDRFPDTVGADPLPDLYKHAGRLEVVRFLRQHLTRQQSKKA